MSTCPLAAHFATSARATKPEASVIAYLVFGEEFLQCWVQAKAAPSGMVGLDCIPAVQIQVSSAWNGSFPELAL